MCNCSTIGKTDAQRRFYGVEADGSSAGYANGGGDGLFGEVSLGRVELRKYFLKNFLKINVYFY